MTFLGKLCVMINVGISLMLAFIALGLYFNGVDWGYDVAKPGTMGGLVKQKQDEIAEVQKMQLPTEGAWKAARPVLWKAEEERADAVEFYVKELKHNRVDAKEGAPARAIVLDDKKDKLGNYRAVRPDPKKPNRPLMQPTKVRDGGVDLASRAYYEAELEKNHKDNLVLLDQLAKEFLKDAELTKLVYDKVTDTGLQPDLVNERIKRLGIEEERRQVKPLYVNTAVESELALKRLAAMRDRIKDLKAYCEKRKMDVSATKE